MNQFSLKYLERPFRQPSEQEVSEIALEVIKGLLPESVQDPGLAAIASRQEDHFMISVISSKADVYDLLLSTTGDIEDRISELGIPSLVYPRAIQFSASRAKSQAELVARKGRLRLEFPTEPEWVGTSTGVKLQDFSVTEAHLLNRVRLMVPSATKIPPPIRRTGPDRTIRVSVDKDEYLSARDALPVHFLLDPDETQEPLSSGLTS